VVYLNDTPKARHVSTEWHRLWLSSYAKLCDYRDQPALNAALNTVGPSIFVLPDKYNAQFKETPSSFYEAVLWHYYAACPEMITDFEIAIEQIVRGTPKTDICDLVTSYHPWRCDRLLDSVAVAWLMRSNNGGGWAEHLLRREMKKYFVSRFSAAYQRSLPVDLRRAIRRQLGRLLP
jgi:hypothetical protein